MKRKPNRLPAFDYSQPGAYFLTICAKDKEKLFSKVVGGGALDAPKVELTEIGAVVEKYILSTGHIENVAVAHYVIMPNHIHLLVTVRAPEGSSRAPTPTNAVIPRLVSALKHLVNAQVGRNVFQRSYHDHIIRDEEDYGRIWQYIDTNPAKWREDCYYEE